MCAKGRVGAGKESGEGRGMQGEGGEKRGRTCFDDLAAGREIEPVDDEGDIGEVEDLGPVWEGEGPKFGGGAEEVNEALSIARADLGAVGDTDEVSMAVDAVLEIEFFSGRDDEGLDEVSGLMGGKKK